jgi:hypothetical protein
LIKILVGSWFELPKLGKDTFLLLMKQGVKYETGLGFKLDGDTRLDGAVNILSSALGEEVELSLRCFVCGIESCPGCPYLDVCDRRRVSPSCLCEEHARVRGGYKLYSSTFRENL